MRRVLVGNEIIIHEKPLPPEVIEKNRLLNMFWGGAVLLGYSLLLGGVVVASYWINF